MSVSMMLKKQIFILTLLTICYVTVAQIGDNCTLRSNDQPGICKLGPDCPIVEEQARKGISPTLCGFHELTTPIVCCETNTFPEANENSFLTETNVHFPDNNPVQVLTNNNLRISEQKCEDYIKPITGVVQVIPLVTQTVPINITVVKCDYNSVPLIVGGKPASPGEFPFMAAIGFDTDDEKWRCGGTLISDRFVLTAAHCTYTRDAMKIVEGQPTVVRLGDLVLSSSNDGSVHKDYKIEKIINHPDWDYSQKYNDISLIKTEKQIKFTHFIRPACLYTKNDLEQSVGTATGWGKTDFAEDNSDRLMKVTLNIYDNQQCYKTYQNNKDLTKGITSSMLCAGEIKGGKDTCQGDSGGPLIITKEGNQCIFFVVGITSFGKSCGQVNTPAIYTKVSYYLDWIEKTIW